MPKKINKWLPFSFFGRETFVASACYPTSLYWGTDECMS